MNKYDIIDNIRDMDKPTVRLLEVIMDKEGNITIIGADPDLLIKLANARDCAPNRVASEVACWVADEVKDASKPRDQTVRYYLDQYIQDHGSVTICNIVGNPREFDFEGYSEKLFSYMVENTGMTLADARQAVLDLVFR